MVDLAVFDDMRLLVAVGCVRPKLFDNGRWAAIQLQGSFYFILAGDLETIAVGYTDSWGYPTLRQAGVALHEWDGEGQPREWVSARIGQGLTVWP